MPLFSVCRVHSDYIPMFGLYLSTEKRLIYLKFNTDEGYLEEIARKLNEKMTAVLLKKGKI